MATPWGSSWMRIGRHSDACGDDREIGRLRIRHLARDHRAKNPKVERDHVAVITSMAANINRW